MKNNTGKAKTVFNSTDARIAIAILFGVPVVAGLLAVLQNAIY